VRLALECRSTPGGPRRIAKLERRDAESARDERLATLAHKSDQGRAPLEPASLRPVVHRAGGIASALGLLAAPKRTGAGVERSAKYSR
jgi:hypothetical protein